MAPARLSVVRVSYVVSKRPKAKLVCGRFSSGKCFAGHIRFDPFLQLIPRLTASWFSSANFFFRTAIASFV